jgi:hypothetical protein
LRIKKRIVFLKIVAERHYFRTIIVRAWTSWRYLIDERHNEDRSERIAIQFYYHTIERRVLDAWKLVEICFELKYWRKEVFCSTFVIVII